MVPEPPALGIVLEGKEGEGSATHHHQVTGAQLKEGFDCSRSPMIDSMVQGVQYWASGLLLIVGGKRGGGGGGMHHHQVTGAYLEKGFDCSRSPMIGSVMQGRPALGILLVGSRARPAVPGHQLSDHGRMPYTGRPVQGALPCLILQIRIRTFFQKQLHHSELACTQTTRA